MAKRKTTRKTKTTRAAAAGRAGRPVAKKSSMAKLNQRLTNSLIKQFKTKANTFGQSLVGDAKSFLQEKHPNLNISSVNFKVTMTPVIKARPIKGKANG